MLQGKITMVTGANTGIGKVVALELARQGATVLMVCRDAVKGREAQGEIVRLTGNNAVKLLIADLSSQNSIRGLVREFEHQYSQLHVLVNNAGAHIQQRQVSVDGIEMNLAINHLANFLLTNLLLDTIRASAPARIVNVASNSMTTSINFEDIQSVQNFEPFKVYGQSKLAMVLCSYGLARRLNGTGVTVNTLHPGITATNIVSDVAPPLARPFLRIIKRFLQTPEQGAQTALYLASGSEVAGISGKYFVRNKEKLSVPISYDKAVQERMWQISAELTWLKE